MKVLSQKILLKQTSWPENLKVEPKQIKKPFTKDDKKTDEPVTFESLTNFTPIFGIVEVKILSLEDATLPLLKLIPKIKELVSKSKFPYENKLKQTGILNIDEAASIYLYTLESDVYKLLNKGFLGNKREEVLKPFYPYLKLLLTALEKLPTYQKHVVFRGFKFASSKDPNINAESKSKLMKLYKQLESEKSHLVMWNLSSTTEKNQNLESEKFCGNKGFRIAFTINASQNKPLSGKDIQNYSSYAKEAEILFSPGCVFLIQGIADMGSDLHMIQLEEVNLTKPMIPLK